MSIQINWIEEYRSLIGKTIEKAVSGFYNGGNCFYLKMTDGSVGIIESKHDYDDVNYTTMVVEPDVLKIPLHTVLELGLMSEEWYIALRKDKTDKQKAMQEQHEREIYERYKAKYG